MHQHFFVSAMNSVLDAKMLDPLALQAWGSFRDVLYKYAETLSSPSKAHPQVAKEMQLLVRHKQVRQASCNCAVVSSDCLSAHNAEQRRSL